jgi:hypothetical protein
MLVYNSVKTFDGLAISVCVCVCVCVEIFQFVCQVNLKYYS